MNQETVISNYNITKRIKFNSWENFPHGLKTWQQQAKRVMKTTLHPKYFFFAISGKIF
jgi:CDP-diacylglycerol pyrophosphatase